MNRDLEATPAVALAVAVFAASTSAILVRWSAAPSSVAAFYRVLFTTVLVAPIAVTRHRAAFARLSRRDLAGAVVAGVALAIHFAAWFESLNHTSVAASVTIVQVQPVFVALGAALLLDERISRATGVGIVVAIAGAAAMSLGDAGRGASPARRRTATPSPSWRGDRRQLHARRSLDPATGSGASLRDRRLRCLCDRPVPLGRRAGPPLRRLPRSRVAALPRPGHRSRRPRPHGEQLVLAHLESVVVSVAWLGEPVGATLLAFVLLAEVPDAITVGGGLVVLAGVAVTTLERERHRGSD